MNVRDHMLLIVLLSAVLLIGFTSYNRFMVEHDYLVTYEGECDPEIQSCFIGCEDDACTVEYHYSLIEKYAADVYAQCGPDITECDAAYACIDTDTACSITYCDPATDGDSCELVEESTGGEEDSGDEALEDALVDEAT